jgi:hypothetical protein
METVNFRSADASLWNRAMLGAMTDDDEERLMSQQKSFLDMDATKTLFIASTKVNCSIF